MRPRVLARAAVVTGMSLALLAPVGADASYPVESVRTDRAERADASDASEPARTGRAERADARATPYIRNINRFHVVCCVNLSEPYTVDYCPDNFDLWQTARLGVSRARGDWVRVHWIKLLSNGNHWNKLTELLLLGDDGGVHGYTLGPWYKRNSTTYKRIKAFPNPTDVKYSGNHVVLDLRGKYAPGKNVPYSCRVYGDSEKIFIHR
jgi:hypothetical protein